MNRIALLFILAAAIACGPGQEKQSQTEEVNVSIEVTSFGTMPDGKEVNQYTLTSATGMEMSVINYGGIITSLMVPDRDGNMADVVLGYDNLQGYIDNNPYFGAIIGRYGNRIAKGKFTLDGIEYSLAQNNIGNHLHGGEFGFDKVYWDIESFEKGDDIGLYLTYTSADGEEGYPGTLEVKVTYTLSGNSLQFDYEATTDKKTVVNLTQHTYFNLSGMDEGILGHQLKLNASAFLPVDSTLIPTGELRDVNGTPFDFTDMKMIGAEIEAENQQLEFGGGYDHCWVLDQDGSFYEAAVLYHEGSGRQLTISTNEPAIQFYSGNFLDGTITGKSDKVYNFRSGLCLETQHYPDSPNYPEFPSTVLNPGETYSSRTLLEFGTR